MSRVRVFSGKGPDRRTFLTKDVPFPDKRSRRRHGGFTDRVDDGSQSFTVENKVPSVFLLDS